MKRSFYLICSALLLTMISCSSEDDLILTPEDERKYHYEVVNPLGKDFTVYQAAAFCGDGYSNQIQIWASSLSECQCLLDEFISDCDDEITYLDAFTLKTSKYPPIDTDCNG